MKKIYFISALILIFPIFLLGCATTDLRPKELRDTELAIRKAEILSKNIKCPEAFHEVYKLWQETQEIYKNPCLGDGDWAAKARMVREKVSALCPEPEKYAAIEEKKMGKESLRDSDGDGVPDSLDKCPQTPKDVLIDENGCPKDADGDGVPDFLDRCAGTPRCAQVDETGCWSIENVNFDFDKYNIKPGYYSNLNEVADCLRENPGIRLDIAGHADIIGTSEYNLVLSEERANSVKNYLLDKGLDRVRFTTIGFGYTKPIAPNDTEEGRAENRRVEMKQIH